MKTFICVVTGVLVSATASVAAKDTSIKLTTAPSGEYAVGWASSEHVLWIASTKDGTDLGDIKLSHLADMEEGSEFIPLPFISPDSNWIFVPSRHAEVDPTLELEALLLHQVPSKKPPFELVLALEFGRHAWEFLVKELKLKTSELGADARRVFSVHFVDWSEDSGRLLISVGSSVVSSKDTWLEGDPNPFYFCYFNTHSGGFELTERLRLADQVPRAEPGEAVKLTAVVTSAESIGKEGPLRSPEGAFKEADARLNGVYNQLIGKLGPAQQAMLREEQRAWIRSRDNEATIWVLQTWSSDSVADARSLERKAAYTQARIKDLEERLERP
jgi:hypothetical protein